MAIAALSGLGFCVSGNRRWCAFILAGLGVGPDGFGVDLEFRTMLTLLAELGRRGAVVNS